MPTWTTQLDQQPRLTLPHRPARATRGTPIVVGAGVSASVTIQLWHITRPQNAYIQPNIRRSSFGRLRDEPIGHVHFAVGDILDGDPITRRPRRLPPGRDLAQDANTVDESGFALQQETNIEDRAVSRLRALRIG